MNGERTLPNRRSLDALTLTGGGQPFKQSSDVRGGFHGTDVVGLRNKSTFTEAAEPGFLPAGELTGAGFDEVDAGGQILTPALSQGERGRS